MAGGVIWLLEVPPAVLKKLESPSPGFFIIPALSKGESTRPL